MGTYYSLYAEAKIKDEWHGIDLYTFLEKYEPVEIIGGKSAVGAALYDNDMMIPIAPEKLSPELKRDHPWYQEEHDYHGQFTYYIEGSDIDALRLDKPEYCGFVDKTDILAFENGYEEIDTWLTAKEYAKLPPDARIGYEWYTWNERYGDHEIWRIIKQGLIDRVNAYNEARFGLDELRPSLSIKDCRVIVFIS